MALLPVRKTIQDLPENFFTQVIIFSASAPRCARVCKGWQKAIAERCYPLIVYNYRQDIKIGRFTQGGTTLPFETVKQTYLAVMSKTDVPHIRSEMEGLDRSMPLALGPIVEIIENANLVQFFGKLNEKIPDDERPKLEGDLAERSAAIRDWMENHRASFDQLQKINLSRLNITILPQEIGKLTNLTALNLFRNPLTTLSEQIPQLTNLDRLKLASIELINLQQHPLRSAVIANSCTLDEIVRLFEEKRNQAALKMFGRLPPDIKNGIYGELRKRPSFEDKYDGYAEDAFLQRVGQNPSNEMRIRAIKNFLHRV